MNKSTLTALFRAYPSNISLNEDDRYKYTLLDEFYQSLSLLSEEDEIPKSKLQELAQSLIVLAQNIKETNAYYFQAPNNPVNKLCIEVIKLLVSNFPDDFKYHEMLPNLSPVCKKTEIGDEVEELALDDIFISSCASETDSTHHIYSIACLVQTFEVLGKLFYDSYLACSFSKLDIMRLMQHKEMVQLIGEYYKKFSVQTNALTRSPQKKSGFNARKLKHQNLSTISYKTLNNLLALAKILKEDTSPDFVESQAAMAICAEYLKTISSEEEQLMKSRLLLIEDKQEKTLFIIKLGTLTDKIKNNTALGKECHHKLGRHLHAFYQDLTTGKKSLSALETLRDLTTPRRASSTNSTELEKPQNVSPLKTTSSPLLSKNRTRERAPLKNSKRQSSPNNKKKNEPGLFNSPRQQKVNNDNNQDHDQNTPPLQNKTRTFE